MTVSNRYFLTACFTLFVSLFSSGQQPQIEIDSHAGNGYSIQVSRPVTLSRLLEAFCNSSRAKCEGIENAASVSMAPGTFSGNWESLVSRMLEGTNLNYVATVPTEAHPGQLVVSKAPAGPAVPSLAPEPYSASSSEQGSESTAPVAETSQPSEAVLGPVASPESAPAQDANSSAFGPSPVASSAGLGSLGEGASVLPFTDSQGRPIQVTGEPTRYLPVMNAQGNPIPVMPVQGAMLPIRDANGNLIPVQPMETVTVPLPIRPPEPH